jgi:POTRA domain-containing FtsQ-type protein
MDRAGGRDRRGGRRSRLIGGGRPRLPRLFAPVRAGGLLGLLAAGALLRVATTTPTFALDRIERPSLQWTAPDAILAAVGVPLGTNVFGIETRPIAERLAALPAVASAGVSVALPSVLQLSITERQPILAWRVGETTYLVDRDGVLFATGDPTTIAGPALPVVTDERVSSPFGLDVGARLDPVDLDVATRLGALVPSDIGSAASRLGVRVNDTDGWVLRAANQGWVAVFGVYSPTLRSTDLIPGQVQLLRSFLAEREATVERVVLADDRYGTYTLRETPKP